MALPNFKSNNLYCRHQLDVQLRTKVLNSTISYNKDYLNVSYIPDVLK